MGTRPVGHGHAGGMLGPLTEDDERVVKRPRRNMRRLLPYFRPYRRRVFLTILLMLVVTGATLATPALAQVAIDDGIDAGSVTALVVIVGSSSTAPAMSSIRSVVLVAVVVATVADTTRN